MENTYQPLALAPACVPAVSLAAAAVSPAAGAVAQVHVLGLTAVGIRIRTASAFAAIAATGLPRKINYNGITSAKGKGSTTPIMSIPTVSVARDHQVQLQFDAIEGGNARGIPPRGRPV